MVSQHHKEQSCKADSNPAENLPRKAVSQSRKGPSSNREHFRRKVALGKVRHSSKAVLDRAELVLAKQEQWHSKAGLGKGER